MRVASGVIHYRLYRQDGTMQPMSCSDTDDNRRYVLWMSKFDKYQSRLPMHVWLINKATILWDRLWRNV